MKHLSLILALLFVSFGNSGTPAVAEQYRNIKPEWRCHFPRKDRSFCKVFPNFSIRHNICNPMPEIVGNIEWCREEITVTDRLPCGEYETYRAVVITYRPVYANGAWGDKFTRTYRRDTVLIITPPLLATGSYK